MAGEGSNSGKGLWAGMSPMGRTIVGVMGVAFVIGTTIFVGMKVYNSFIAHKDTKEGRDEIKETDKTVKQLQDKGIKLSYPEAQYKTWANSLKVAADGCGTSNQVWKNIFAALKTELDVYQLISAFGIQKIDDCGWGSGDSNYTLGQMLADELGDDELVEVNAMLTSKKINFQF